MHNPKGITESIGPNVLAIPRKCLGHRTKVLLLRRSLGQRVVDPGTDGRSSSGCHGFVRRFDDSSIHRDGDAFLSCAHTKMFLGRIMMSSRTPVRHELGHQ
jgi:hypothetical protein